MVKSTGRDVLSVSVPALVEFMVVVVVLVVAVLAAMVLSKLVFRSRR